jgi:hypothetical protein
MNVPPIIIVLAGNVLRISCWNITKWWSNVTLLTINQSICDDNPPILFPKKPPWKGEKSPSLPTPPTKTLQPSPFFLEVQLYHVILFIQSNFNYLPLISSWTPTPNNHPFEEAKKKKKTSTLCSPLPKFSSITLSHPISPHLTQVEKEKTYN